jgi:hypothetical protein
MFLFKTPVKHQLNPSDRSNGLLELQGKCMEFRSLAMGFIPAIFAAKKRFSTALPVEYVVRYCILFVKVEKTF